jgi:hypothetical protein
MNETIHAAAPDGTPECDSTDGVVTETIDNVNCPACLALISPWLDGTANPNTDPNGNPR